VRLAQCRYPFGRRAGHRVGRREAVILHRPDQVAEPAARSQRRRHLSDSADALRAQEEPTLLGPVRLEEAHPVPARPPRLALERAHLDQVPG
jgi:hypothetical protein